MNDPQQPPLDHERLLRQAMAPSDATSASSPPPPGPEELAALFPELDVQEVIGRGGMGAVYKAVQRRLGRPVAVKVLDAELARDPEFGERFLREARALATLDHPGILTVHDFGERDGLFFLVTEFVDGVNLRQLMELGELSPAEALRIAPQICVALQYAHERGVVHRDVKPENILIDTAGRVKLADFGLAKVIRQGDQAELTRSTAVFGTPHYMAPEQWRGTGRVDHRADIYSLGVVLYEMLTGQLPLGHFEPPSARGGVPRGLDDVVRRALAQQPEKRYQQVREVRDDVERQARNLGADERRPTAGERRPLVLAPLFALAALLITVLAAGWLVHLTQQQARREHEFRTELALFDARAHNNAEYVRSGRPTAEIGTLPSPPPVPAISTEALRAAVFGAGAGVALLVVALGVFGLRAIRNSGGRRRGLGLAVLTAWLVPLAIVDALAAAPVGWIRNDDLRTVTGLVLGIGLAAGNAWFVIRRVRRQQALIAAGVPMESGGGIAAFLVLLAFAAFAAGGSAGRWLPPDLDARRWTAGPTPPSQLIGRSRSAVIDRLGPPTSIEVSANSEMWSYLDPNGEVVRYALVFSSGRVLVGDRATPIVMPNRATPGEPHLGLPIEEFVEAYGAPVGRTEGALLTELTFANGVVVSVHDGIAVGVER